MYMCTREQENKTTIRLSMLEEMALKKHDPKKDKEKEKEKDKDKEEKEKPKELTSTSKSKDDHPLELRIVPLEFEKPSYLDHPDAQQPDDIRTIKVFRKLPETSFNVHQLFKEIYSGHVKGVRYFLKYVSIKSVDIDGKSPLMASLFIASATKSIQMMKFLLHRGAQVGNCDRICGRDIFGWACLMAKRAELEYLLSVHEDTADFAKLDKEGSTYLHLCVLSTDFEVTRLIVERMKRLGLAIDQCNQTGLTPYLLARRLGLRDVAQYLHVQGGASDQRHDDALFKSPREWSQIGHRERQLEHLIGRPVPPLSLATIAELGAALTARDVTDTSTLEVQRAVPSVAANRRVAAPLPPPLLPPPPPPSLKNYDEVIHRFMEQWSAQSLPSWRKKAVPETATRRPIQKHNAKRRESVRAFNLMSKNS